MNDVGSITRTERRWTLVFACIIVLLTSLPYLLGFAFQGDSARFSGFVIGVEDGNSYIAKMLSGSEGAWLFRTPYTPYPQDGVLQFIPYLLLGKLAATPGIHEQLVVLYHIFRVVAGIFMVLATYRFLAVFLSDVRYRRLGLVLAILGGGLGWLLVLAGQDSWFGSLPLSFYSPESFGFLGLYGFPHLAMARALLLWALVIYLEEAQEADGAAPMIQPAVKLTGLWLLAGLMQPLVLVVLGVVIGVHLVGMAVWVYKRPEKDRPVEWSRWLRLVRLALVSGLLPGIMVLYNLWLIWGDPFFAAWSEQNIIKSPHPLHYLLAYGLLFPFAWVGGRWLMQSAPWKGWLLVGWVLSLPLLAYAPVNLQRRLPEGIWIAWIALSMAAFEKPVASTNRSPKRRKFWLAVVLTLAFPSTLLLFAGGVMTAVNVDTPVYRSAQEVEVFEALQSEADAYPVVLAAYETGNALPAWAPVRVVIGHGPESVNLAELRPQIAAFYSQETAHEARLDFLNRFDIRFVFWGPAERELGSWDPNQAPYLQLLYQAGAYSLFEFDRSFVVGYRHH